MKAWTAISRGDAIAEVPARLRAARIGVAVTYFILGAAFASWISRIPAIRDRLELGPGALGAALLGASVGSLLSMTPAGRFIAREGSQFLVRVAAISLCMVILLPALAGSLLDLTLALVLLGTTSGALNVAVNAQAAAVERAYGRPIMASFHGIFSVGGLVGAAVGGIFADRGVAPVVHLVTVGAVLAALAWIATRYALPASAEVVTVTAGPTTAIGRPTRALMKLGIIAFCVLLGEGAMADWSAVYLRDRAGATPGQAAAGYAAFSLAMALGRLVGDGLAVRFGPRRLVRGGGLAATLGIGLALVYPTTWAVLLGFGVVGAGYSVLFPTLLSAAGRGNAGAPSAAIASLSTLGFLGFLIGPPLIGLTATWITLQGALGWVMLAGIAVVALAPAIDAPAPTAAEELAAARRTAAAL